MGTPGFLPPPPGSPKQSINTNDIRAFHDIYECGEPISVGRPLQKTNAPRKI